MMYVFCRFMSQHADVIYTHSSVGMFQFYDVLHCSMGACFVLGCCIYLHCSISIVGCIFCDISYLYLVFMVFMYNFLLVLNFPHTFHIYSI